MIFQRFAPISPFLNRIQSICCLDDDPYFSYQYSLSIADVTAWILNNENLLESTLDHIANLSFENKIMDYVRSAAPERRFLLYTAIQISFLHFDADKEKVPLIPIEGVYPFVAAYLQEGFASFKRHCHKEGLLIWDQIIEYELVSHLPIAYTFLLARIVFYCVVFGQRCHRIASLKRLV